VVLGCQRRNVAELGVGASGEQPDTSKQGHLSVLAYS